MNKLELAERVIQRAYDIDIGKRLGTVNPSKALSCIGVTAFHVCYYDGGLAQLEEIRQHVRNFPDGQLVRLLMRLRDTRLGEYSAETLNKMYGLE